MKPSQDDAERWAAALPLDPRARPAEVLVALPVAYAEQCFRRSVRQWLGPGAEARPGSRVAAEEALAGGTASAPTVLWAIADGEVRMRFVDGRHRYCVLRDAGATRINVGMVQRWARHLERLGTGLIVGRRV